MPKPSLSTRLRKALQAAADPGRAPAMQAYMKSDMPFLGVPARPLRAACKAVFVDLAYADSVAWQADVRDIWRGARFREQRYAAIELTGTRAAAPFQTVEALPLYEEMIVTGAWWDFVDTIAAHRLGAILKADPAAMKSAMRRWARSEDMWKRRSAILCQLLAKGATDLQLLEACMKSSLESKEFFLRKAIGWALRQHARTDPDWVRAYVANHESLLSPLSRREAMKHLGK
jgi:3-methyladenine DNA glycosylase AlkD